DHHGGTPGIVDRGLEGDQFPDLYGIEEIYPVHRGGNAIALGMFGSTGKGDLVHQIQDMAPVYLAPEVGMGREHQLCNGYLTFLSGFELFHRFLKSGDSSSWTLVIKYLLSPNQKKVAKRSL